MPAPVRIGRRTILRGGVAAGGAALGAAALGGCAGLTRRVSSTSSGGRDRVTMQVYGTDVETEVYARLGEQFAAERGVTVDLTVVPFADFATGVDAGLLSGTAPDVFRVDYPTMGLYAATGQLLDVTDPLAELAQDVRPALMEAVTFGGRRYGIPQHVDTTALVYRPDVLRDAGVTSVPDRPEDAWSWEEFGDVADRVRDAAPDGRSAFAVNWQAAGAFRWLTWLFMAGGHLYDEELTSAALDDDAGRRALEFTRSFFENGWVPGTTSTKSPTYPDAQFTAGRLGMLFAGNFLVPAFAETIGDRFEYAVTYQPRDERRASELGGNAVVATRDSANPELAADLLVYLSSPEAMQQFCEASVLLPTRESLAAEDLDFAVGGDLMGVYADQVTTIEDRDVADVTTPTFAEVNVDLANELEECFLGGRSAAATLRAIADRVDASAALNDGAAS
ncbi:sugar ABC transporter substrate-binding protein [Nocardioides zeae]|uniref:Sugar ABC transporter substrate-binding protein n=1 Tax=Nocardioides imazamoxiresistens TaxID=3231893 RepID=A0ABU3Q0C6_9ACTN|nr:sugar ABC transporter substrate-binding protein [Nocardioides zeae]MDT9594973.1 sugar ABC transporter substrate-binding protein [Nocardioides zeae]